MFPTGNNFVNYIARQKFSSLLDISERATINCFSSRSEKVFTYLCASVSDYNEKFLDRSGDLSEGKFPY